MLRVENVAMIKGSSSSVQEAHNIWLFNPLGEKEEVFMKDHSLCRELRIGKSRYNGRATGSRIIYTLNPISEFYEEHSVR